jgi:hypothetical protein
VDHIGFATRDLAALRHLQVQEAPGDPYRLRGKRSAWFSGPDGLRIELIEEPQ